MSDDTRAGTHQKALRLNLDETIFGSFAEIGAGQEVARWFLRVGAASGTVAKTISAYDKQVSDDLYGSGTRYVSRQRLEAMLACEWGQLHSQVGAGRGAKARLFAFADTVAARNYAGTNDANGWIGVRFQDRPGGEPNDLLLHVNMRDQSGVQQQEALGVLGVNLLHALYYECGSADEFLGALVEGLEAGRLEIDLIDFEGGRFDDWERGATLARLISRGMAEAVVFPGDGRALPPSEVLYRAPVVLVPGTFEHVEPVHAQILAAGLGELRAELGKRPSPSAPDNRAAEPVAAYCLTAAGVAPEEKGPGPVELHERAQRLHGLGAPVVLSRRREHYHVVALVNRYTKEPVRFAVGVAVLFRIFAEAYYRSLEGQVLEGVSRLFASNVRFYVYPMRVSQLDEQLAELARCNWEVSPQGDVVGADHCRPPPPLGHLYDYLLASRFIVPMNAAHA